MIKILVNYYGDESFDYGDVIQVKGLIYEPSNNTIPNSFNYKKYLNNKNIFYIMKSSDIKMISKNSNILYKLKSIIIKRINKIDTTGYIKTFILGDKSSLSNYKNYQDLGVSHLFAISGVHIGLFSFFILKVFRRYKFKTIVLDLFLIIYGFIILFPASILRTIVFLFLKQINDKYNINVSNIKILFITAFILIAVMVSWSLHLYGKVKNAKFVNESTYPVKASEWILNNLDINDISFLVSGLIIFDSK